MSKHQTATDLSFDAITGQAVRDYVDDVARLRIAVFRAWPYLYDGDLDYERWYLGKLAETDGAVIVVVRAGSHIVGASTGMPLAREHAAFQDAMRAARHEPTQWFYCAESVLDPAFRGQGAGHRFFDAREAHARALGFTQSCFCAVQRPDKHPMADPSVRPLEPFWHGRGYRPIEGAVAQFGWKDIGDAEETEKPLQFWGRALEPVS